MTCPTPTNFPNCSTCPIDRLDCAAAECIGLELDQICWHVKVVQAVLQASETAGEVLDERKVHELAEEELLTEAGIATEDSAAQVAMGA